LLIVYYINIINCFIVSEQALVAKRQVDLKYQLLDRTAALLTRAETETAAAGTTHAREVEAIIRETTAITVHYFTWQRFFDISGSPKEVFNSIDIRVLNLIISKY